MERTLLDILWNIKLICLTALLGVLLLCLVVVSAILIMFYRKGDATKSCQSFLKAVQSVMLVVKNFMHQLLKPGGRQE